MMHYYQMRQYQIIITFYYILEFLRVSFEVCIVH